MKKILCFVDKTFFRFWELQSNTRVWKRVYNEELNALCVRFLTALPPLICNKRCVFKCISPWSRKFFHLYFFLNYFVVKFSNVCDIFENFQKVFETQAIVRDNIRNF